MPNRTLTPVTELDFDGIRQNLKNYLSTTTEFSDFDYEGSGIGVLLDLLSYNTHYTAMYANMLAAESFIDSAVLRKSVVSLAKNLGYIPNSKNAARATVNLTFGVTLGVPSTIPIGTVFTASNGSAEYKFTTIESHAINKNSVPYTATNVEIHQGQYKSASFVYDADSNMTKFEIQSQNLDKDMIRIYVMKSASDLTNADVNWKENTDYLELTPTTKVYFLTENHRGNYEISFGDGILGAVPDKGSYIVVVYFDTDGAEANGIGNGDVPTGTSSFTFDGINGNDYSAVVETVSAAAGGAERDSQEKIRYAAPKYYQSQDRTVTAQDYESVILREYPDAEAVRVWGGEENEPPEYGKVFISILPKNSRVLSDSQKRMLTSTVLDKKKIVSINAEIVDVDYTHVFIDCFATYSSANAFSKESLIKDAIRAAIYKYSDLSLQIFGSAFRYSLLSRQIDLSNGSMVSNRISTKLMKKLTPISGAGNYTMYFGTPLQMKVDNSTTLTSSPFQYYDSKRVLKTSYLEDNGSGKIQIYTVEDGKKKILSSNIGTIDYATGKVSIVGLSVASSGTDPYIKIVVVPDQRYDIHPLRNQILIVDSALPESINITLQDSARGI